MRFRGRGGIEHGFEFMTPRLRLRFALWVACVFAQIIGTLIWLFALRGARILNSDSSLIGGWSILLTLSGRKMCLV